MAIPFTNLHGSSLLEQIETTLMNMHYDMANNAIAWKAMAQTQSVPLSLLQTYILGGTDPATNTSREGAAPAWLRLLQYIIDLRADATKRAILQAALAKRTFDETADIVNFVQALRPVALAVQAADVSSYASISTMCDQLSTAVGGKPMSLYPR